MDKTEFSVEQFDAIYPEGIENHYWTLARNLIIEKKLRHYRLENKRLMEVGCGRGIVVNFLRNRGFDCYGVELSDINLSADIAPYVQKGIDFSKIDKDTANSVDVLMLFDVIEHIENDIEFVKKLSISFPNAEYLVITVPAKEEIWSNYDEYNGHYRRYSIAKLDNTLSKSGWKKNEVGFIFKLLYVPARILLKVSSGRNLKISPPSHIMVLIHRLIAYFFVMETIFPFNIFGTSILSVSTRDKIIEK